MAGSTIKPEVLRTVLHSLLEKAVRRGKPKLVTTICACIDDLQDSPTHHRRLTRQAVASVFKECWPLAQRIHFSRKYHSKVAVLTMVAGAVKNKDAAGLGALAHAYAQGDRSPLDQSDEDRPIKIVANGLKRPHDFFEWAMDLPLDDHNRQLIEQARKYEGAANTQDRTVMIAAAYLATAQPLPTVVAGPSSDNRMDYWVALDLHTPPGQWAYGMLAKELHMEPRQLAWAGFFEAGAQCDASVPAPWWDRYRYWQCAQVGLSADELHLLWGPAHPQLIDYLSPKSDQLHRFLYQWKIAHMDRINQLRQQVTLFLDHYHEMQVGQRQLFDRKE